MNKKLTWDTFIAQHPAGTILQTSRWGQFKAEFGWQWETVGLHDDVTGELQSGALVLYKPFALGLGTIAYVPRGPVVKWHDSQHVAHLLEKITQAARQRRAWALWIDPKLLKSPEAHAQLRSLGLRPAHRVIQPPSTILVDITLSEDEILARMKQKTRYNIRLAGRKGVTIQEGGADEAPIFYKLMQETSERDGFSIHSQAYYRRALELFKGDSPAGHAKLLFANVEEHPVAALMVFASGKKSWYFYGASSNQHREKMPTYALQWAAIQWAKRQGCTTYDLWGIPDADEATLEAEFLERRDGLWGVYRFKRGFGGDVVRYVGVWEKPLHPLYSLAASLYTYGHGHS